MACGCSSACAGCSCECHRFTSPAAAGRAGQRLAGMWDRMRDLYSRAGLRPYSVTIVRAQAASLRRRGDGPYEVTGEWAILPTPKIGDLTGLQEVLSVDQLRELGSIVLSEISLRYSEDVLQGRGPSGSPIPAGETFFYEVAYLDGTGRATARRRFIPGSAPFADMARGQWTISLTRAPWDRERDGVLR